MIRKIGKLTTDERFQAKPIKTMFKILTWELIRALKLQNIYVRNGSDKLLVSFNDGIGRMLHYYGEYELVFQSIMAGVLRKDSVFVDVGANVGLYTKAAQKILGEEGRVIAFEPNPEVYPRLAFNTGVLKRVVTENLAVTDEEREFNFAQHGDSAKSHIVDDSNQNTVTVKGLPLDTYMNGEFIDYLKIDVEGFEFQVLKGARKLLKANQIGVVQVEVLESPDEIFELFNSAGYEVYVCRKKTLLKSDTVMQFAENLGGRKWNCLACLPKNGPLINDLMERYYRNQS